MCIPLNPDSQLVCGQVLIVGLLRTIAGWYHSLGIPLQPFLQEDGAIILWIARQADLI